MMQDLLQNVENSWTDSQIKLLKKWRKEAIGLVWKHNVAANSYSFWDTAIGIPTTILSTITGTAIFVSIDSQSQCSGKIEVQIIIGSAVILTAILSAMHNFLKYSELSEKHRNSANRFQAFVNSIESELVLKSIERMNGTIFIKQMQKRYSELVDTCPNIPSKITSQYLSKYSKHEFEELLEIVVDETSSDDLIKLQTKNRDDNTTDDNTTDKTAADKTATDKTETDDLTDITDNEKNQTKEKVSTIQNELNQELRNARNTRANSRLVFDRYINT